MCYEKCKNGRGQKRVISHIKLHYPFNNFRGRDSFDGPRVGKLPRFGPISPAPTRTWEATVENFNYATETTGHPPKSSNSLLLN
jgi:hypothetical protein